MSEQGAGHVQAKRIVQYDSVTSASYRCISLPKNGEKEVREECGDSDHSSGCEH